MASGIKVDESCCHMWELFHKGSLTDATTPAEKEERETHLQNVLGVHAKEPEQGDGSDTDSSADEEDNEVQKKTKAKRPRIMTMRVSDNLKTIVLEKNKFNVAMKHDDKIKDTDRCLAKLKKRLTQGSTSSVKRPRWIIVYFDFLTDVDSRPTGKEIMIKWCPDSSSIKQKMYLSSSTAGLCSTLKDFKGTTVQCDCIDDLDDILKSLRKGTLK